MYTPRTSVEAIPNASIHHSALQNRDFGHTYDRSRALVRAIECSTRVHSIELRRVFLRCVNISTRIFDDIQCVMPGVVWWVVWAESPIQI